MFVSGAGTVSLGLDREQRQRLGVALASAELRVGRRRTWRSVAPVARVVVDSDGDPNRPVRDPVIWDVILDIETPSSAREAATIASSASRPVCLGRQPGCTFVNPRKPTEAEFAELYERAL